MGVGSSLPPGSVIGGRYEIRELLNKGGQGAVYEALDRNNGRVRAVKVLLGHHLRDAALVERFHREARVTAHLESEHILEILDAGVDPATSLPFLVMERLRGSDLSQVLAKHGRLPWREVVDLLTQAATGLDRAHEAGIVHRDLKPENLFLSRRDDGSARVRVFDFGIAKVLDGSTAAQTQLIGTPIYMAPEQIRADGRLGPAVDLFALGHVSFALLVGRSYWEEESTLPVHALLLKLLAGFTEPPTVRAARDGVSLPAAFDDWFSVICAERPEERPPTASAAIASLRSVFEPSGCEDAPTVVVSSADDPRRSHDGEVGSSTLASPGASAAPGLRPPPSRPLFGEGGIARARGEPARDTPSRQATASPVAIDQRPDSGTEPLEVAGLSKWAPWPSARALGAFAALAVLAAALSLVASRVATTPAPSSAARRAAAPSSGLGAGDFASSAPASPGLAPTPMPSSAAPSTVAPSAAAPMRVVPLREEPAPIPPASGPKSPPGPAPPSPPVGAARPSKPQSADQVGGIGISHEF